MKINLLPVYSLQAAEEDIPQELRTLLPKGLRLLRHQVETYRALTQGDEEVIFNTAMTGDGKSLAGQLPALVQGGLSYPVLAMYPTNELIEDQMAHLEQTIARWKVNIVHNRLNSAELDRAMDEVDYTRRGEALISLLRNSDFVLTNPDIFHYVMHQFYTWPKDVPDRYSGPLTQKFRQLTFDEFHIFDVPQIVSVLNAILFMHQISGDVRPHKFLFLSATPKELMREYLRKSNMSVKFIDGEYNTGGDPQKWRKILNSVEIHFEKEQHAKNWLDNHLQKIVLPFFLQRRPCAKGAVIVNSRAAALHICEKLKPIFDQYNLKVELNTGWTGRKRRKASYEADLLIGTSTVDVGVDFQINFLIFESDNAGTFLQRLGRLGRHDGYHVNGEWHPFQDFVAYALLPDWIIARIFQKQNGAPPLLQQNAQIERTLFNKVVEQAFPTYSQFEKYAQVWGKFQSVKILLGMGRKPVRDQYKETRPKLQKQYESTFGVCLASALGEYKRMHNQQRPLLEEALCFRGSTLFPCCVIDASDSGAEQFKVVDLLSAISYHNLTYLSENDFYAEARKTGLNPTWFQKQDPLGFFCLGALRDFQKIVFHLHSDISSWGREEFGRAIPRKGFSLDANFPGHSEISRRLRQRILPALLYAGKSPLEIKRRLNLPLLFPLYEFKSDDNINGTVAFGRAALLLDTHLRYHPIDSGGGEAIFV